MKITGIYAIRNTQNNMRYIGHTYDIEGRFIKHKSRLDADEHGSKPLQEDWNNATDKRIFVIDVLEQHDSTTSKEYLQEREQHYLNHFSSLGLAYNHCHNTKGGNGKGEKHPFYGRQVPEETKEKISDTLSGRKLSKEHRENISKSLVGHTRITPEIADKIKQKLRKLSDEEVLEIIARLKQGESTHKIAKDYPVSVGTIKGIRNGAAYSHIPRN